MNEYLLQFFSDDYGNLPDSLRRVAKPFNDMARDICADDDNVLALPRNPERTIALRSLLDARDAAVRAKVAKL